MGTDSEELIDWLKYTAISSDGLWFFCILCGEWQSVWRVTEYGTCQPCEKYVDRLMEEVDGE